LAQARQLQQERVITVVILLLAHMEHLPLAEAEAAEQILAMVLLAGQVAVEDWAVLLV
jgi:hypothetical protein